MKLNKPTEIRQIIEKIKDFFEFRDAIQDEDSFVFRCDIFGKKSGDAIFEAMQRDYHS